MGRGKLKLEKVREFDWSGKSGGEKQNLTESQRK